MHVSPVGFMRERERPELSLDGLYGLKGEKVCVCVCVCVCTLMSAMCVWIACVRHLWLHLCVCVCVCVSHVVPVGKPKASG